MVTMVPTLLLVLAAVLQTSVLANNVQQKLQTSAVEEDCYWKCGKYGVFMECEVDEAVVGACGAKSWANCENREYCPGQNKIYAAIKCCKMKGGN